LVKTSDDEEATVGLTGIHSRLLQHLLLIQGAYKLDYSFNRDTPRWLKPAPMNATVGLTGIHSRLLQHLLLVQESSQIGLFG